MGVKNHPEFDTPSDETTIWRYLDFPKFISFLSSSSLWFTKLSVFQKDDPYEGTLRNAVYKELLRDYSSLSVPEKASMGVKSEEEFNKRKDMWKTLDALSVQQSEVILVNSWHINENESAAMWELYGFEGQGIAISSTVKQFKKAVEKYEEYDILLGKINYIDYEDAGSPFGNLLSPALWKRKSFEHENELRALIWAMKGDPSGIIIPLVTGTGLSVTIHLKELINKIYISPSAPSWHVQVVKNIVDTYGFGFEVVQSKLNDRWAGIK